MQHAALRRRLGFRGGVENQRAHKNYVATLGRTRPFPDRVSERPGSGRRQPSTRVRTSNESYRAVFDTAVVYVHAHSEEPFQNFYRRLDETLALLLRPASQ